MSADDNATEQAREVEVRLVGEAIEDAAMRLKGRDLGTVHRDQIAREALDAIEHIRAAERQEAARAALLGAAEGFEMEQRNLARRTGTVQPWWSATRYLRDRADGVTGRSGT